MVEHKKSLSITDNLQCLLFTTIIMNVFMRHNFVCRTTEPECIQRFHAVPAAHLPSLWIIPVSILWLLQRCSTWSDNVTRLHAMCPVLCVCFVAGRGEDRGFIVRVTGMGSSLAA